MIYRKSQNFKVAVGLSGGVDSSVAAYILKEQGYEVTGVYLECWEAKADGCRGDEDRASAVSAASHLDIPFISLNFTREYREKVISYFFNEYKQGRTPNPDVVCNKDIKFGLFFDWVVSNGYKYVATGHYAKSHNGRLYQGIDEAKDQSYFLYQLTSDRLEKVLFPLGDMYKKDVRKKAENVNLPTSKRPDSQGICFVGEVNIKDFLGKELKPKKGKVLFTDGSEVGEHDGAWYLTVGQRHGFRLHKYFGLPLYVVAKNTTENTITVGYVQDVLSDRIMVDNISWISGKPPLSMTKGESINCLVRIRHLGRLTPSSIRFCHENSIEIHTKDRLFGVAPGQSAVFYLEGEVLGGGIIT